MNTRAFVSESDYAATGVQTELLFQPAIEWMQKTVKGISPPIDMIEKPQTKQEWEKLLERKKEGDLLIATELVPLMRADDLETAYRQHRETQKALTAIKGEASHLFWCRVDVFLHTLTEMPEKNPSLKKMLNRILQNPANWGSYSVRDPQTVLPLNSADSFARIHQLAQKQSNEAQMKKGVFLLDPAGVWIDPRAEIGENTLLLPGTIIKGASKIGCGCTIGPHTLIDTGHIGNRSKINATQVYESTVGEEVSIGPFCHIRPGSIIRDHVKIGDFVEVKNSQVGAGTAISHLTYVGDSDVGKNVNFGCGVVTVNYDGVHKHRCQIGDGAFIGCNTNLIAPVSIGKDGYTAAGSTITKDVPDEALGIERAVQVIKPGFSRKKLKGRKKKV